ncbi:UNVERIFIED_CONTAM: hypothetical protein GTU68_067055 [Idotea baltica]|nr:hypothetical protein [Idotea baltica]
MKTKHLASALLAGLLVASCATDDPNRRAKTGAVLGALAGAAVGNQAKNKNGKLIGAALGGIAGYKIGQYQDQQQKELESALADELAANLIDIQRLENDVLRVNLSSEASFDVNKANLKPPFYPSLDKLAEVVGRYDQTLINVIGHTDSTGDEQYNQALSERRSGAVATYFANGGIADARLSTEGRGETAPRTDNKTSQSRRLNRRVEIDLIPVVKEE